MQAFGEGESPAFRARSKSSCTAVAWRPGTHAARAKQACAAAPLFASWGASRKATSSNTSVLSLEVAVLHKFIGCRQRIHQGPQHLANKDRLRVAPTEKILC